METSFWLPILSLVVTVGSYLVLFTASLRLEHFNKNCSRFFGAADADLSRRQIGTYALICPGAANGPNPPPALPNQRPLLFLKYSSSFDPQKRFAYSTAGFACWLMEQLILFLAPTDFLLGYASYYSLLYPVGLILVVIGFFKLVGRERADTRHKGG